MCLCHSVVKRKLGVQFDLPINQNLMHIYASLPMFACVCVWIHRNASQFPTLILLEVKLVRPNAIELT